jgi:hypothetical protein
MIFAKLDLPALPSIIKQQVIDYTNNYIKTWEPSPNDGYDAVHPNEKINLSKRKVIHGQSFPTITKALQDICPYRIYDVALYLLVNDTNEPGVMPPHTDFNRKFAVNYIIETGGDNVKTSFYEELPDPPIIKNGHIQTRYFNAKSLVEEASAIFKEDDWVAFDAQRPHSVTNVTGKRVVICMSSEFNLIDSDIIKK